MDFSSSALPPFRVPCGVKLSSVFRHSPYSSPHFSGVNLYSIQGRGTLICRRVFLRRRERTLAILIDQTVSFVPDNGKKLGDEKTCAAKSARSGRRRRSVLRKSCCLAATFI